MRLVVEISLYPLKEAYIGPIKDFIERINTYDRITAQTGSTSTVVSGEMNELMQILNKEMQATYAQVGQAIFVCKFLNGDLME
ncbi:YkoF family thiamine/hydroxymethylpyrimidine-binding protein [Aliiglaciecola sp. M165]|uniref:YkoF family thiamine/hydroxymethylpyrimidine-binding protein n=1 Tax=Aliiglaciecola sp. M165 TaxID=2593649 RepID=UPI00117E96A5|nr:YkoF family thiamine/hydroxymethylpyrimidine-binding protein [Aliiglaciecola sp. M165]TRY29442.1 hypothetical protein FM019_18795 [Aliiglaciecola sp. M165]